MKIKAEDFLLFCNIPKFLFLKDSFPPNTIGVIICYSPVLGPSMNLQQFRLSESLSKLIFLNVVHENSL